MNVGARATSTSPARSRFARADRRSITASARVRPRRRRSHGCRVCASPSCSSRPAVRAASKTSRSRAGEMRLAYQDSSGRSRGRHVAAEEVAVDAEPGPEPARGDPGRVHSAVGVRVEAGVRREERRGLAAQVRHDGHAGGGVATHGVGGGNVRSGSGGAGWLPVIALSPPDVMASRSAAVTVERSARPGRRRAGSRRRRGGPGSTSRRRTGARRCSPGRTRGR